MPLIQSYAYCPGKTWWVLSQNAAVPLPLFLDHTDSNEGNYKVTVSVIWIQSEQETALNNSLKTVIK